MAKLKNDDREYFIKGLNENPPIEQNISDNVEKNMKIYGNKVITDRAIADFRDGMKPVHRRILYSILEGKFISNKDSWKSARIVGDCMGKYHPHGDKSIYDAAVNMIVDWKNNFPIIKGKGDFGNIDGDPAAAMRYSEMSITPKIADILFENLNVKNKKGETIIKMIPNYDRKEIEPVFLSVKLPVILFNGSMGIAYSMSANIPSYNKEEIIDAFSNMIEEKFWETPYNEENILNFVKGPDFPTGCEIYERKAGDLKNLILNPFGTIAMKAKIIINEEKKEVKITNVPYTISTNKLFIHILELYKNFLEFKNSKEKYNKPYLSLSCAPFNGTKKGNPEIILNFNEESNLNIEINKLYKYVKGMDVTFNQQFRVLDKNKRVETLGLPRYLSNFLEFRKDMNIKRVAVELEKHYDDLEIQTGILIGIINIDKIQSILKEASVKAKKEDIEEKELENWIINNFISQLNINDTQAKYIADMKLVRLASMKPQAQEDKISKLNAMITDKEDFMSKDERIYNYIKDEMIGYKDEYKRKSELVSNIRNISEEDLIEDVNNMIVYTFDERIYKLPSENFKTQNKGTRGKKLSSKEDIISKAVNGNSLDNIGIITNKGRMFLLKAYMLPNEKSYVKNFFNMEGDEKLIEMIKITKDDFENKNSYIVLVTDNGLVKRTYLSEYNNLNAKGNRGIKAITLNEGDSVNSVFIGNSNTDMIIVSDNNKAIRYDIEQIPYTSRTSKGVIGVRMVDSISKVLKSVNINKEDMVLTIFTDSGNGKKFSVNSIRKIKRGGKGVNIFNEDKNDSKMVDVVVTEDNDEIVLITKNGIINKINSSTINEKRKQAVIANKVMDIDEGDSLMVVLVLKNEEVSEEIIESIVVENIT